jgi:prophage regulatory protein
MNRLIRLPALMDRTGLSRSTIYLLISRGTFPRPVSLGARSVAWIEADVDDWIEARIHATRRGTSTKKNPPDI